MTSNIGVVFGAAYTDVYLRLPLLVALVGASLVAAALSAANIWLRGIRLPVAAVALVFVVSLVGTAVPGLFQRYCVKPDVLRLASGYIAKKSAVTRYGVALENISDAPIPAKGQLTQQATRA